MHFEFRGNDVVLRGRKTAIVSIVPEAKYPQMWRVVRPDGSHSDMVNKTGAKEAALALARSMILGGKGKEATETPAGRENAYTASPKAPGGV